MAAASSNNHAVSGLAASIRSASESEVFDLGNQTVQSIANTIRSAFQHPFDVAEEMIRITFVTGAGKQARQKYDDGAARAVTSTLRELGYTEDRAASCIADCAGCFKLQHDTGKNLKTVVVFPNIRMLSDPSGNNNEDQQEEPPLLLESSPESLIALSSMNVFQRMVQVKCPSWSQKKGCVAALESLKGMLQELDEKLLSGTPLSDPEQDFYDSSVALDDKESFVKTEMQKQVETSKVITQYEKEVLLALNTQRLASLEKDIEKASSGHTKKLEPLTRMRDKALLRKTLLNNTDASTPHKLRYESDINKLRKELVPLFQLEQDTRGRLHSVKEAQILGRKEEIEEEIAQLESRSRGWFEDDDVFASRLESSRALYVTRAKQRRARKVGGGAVSIGASTTTRVSKWLLPGESSAKWDTKAGGKKKKAKGAGGVFSAMVLDSSSEEEEDDDDDGIANDLSVPDSDDDESNGGGVDEEDEDEIIKKAKEEIVKNKKKRKKKKKKGKHKGPAVAETDDEFLSRELASAAAAASAKESAEAPSNSPLAVVQQHVFPVVYFLLDVCSAMLLWLLGLVFGKSKKKRS